jgi:hypothetical protein
VLFKDVKPIDDENVPSNQGTPNHIKSNRTHDNGYGFNKWGLGLLKECRGLFGGFIA